MNSIKTFLLVSIMSLLIVSTTGFSQQYYFDHYSVKEGLAQSKVYSMVQDHLGYIWMGTESGVSQFDGRKFINYTSDDGLAESGVRVVFKDSKERLWFGHTGGGISLYSGSSMVKILHDSLNIEGDITSFAEDKNGKIWIGTHGDGAFLIKNPFAKNVKDFEIVNYTGKQKLSDRIFGILNAKDNTTYFVIDGTIKYFIPDSNTFEFYTPKGIQSYFQVTCMYEDQGGNFWFGTYNGGVFEQDLINDRFVEFNDKAGLSHNWITSILQDEKGNVWVGTWGGGVNRINGNEIKVYDITNGMFEDKIRCLIEDMEGNILIGTNEHGLAIFKGEQFISFTPADGLVNEQVSSILQDESGKYWFGTKKGISIYNPAAANNNHFKHFMPSTSYSASHKFEKDIVFIKQDKNNDIWIGTKNEGIYHYFKQRNKIEYIPRLNFLLNQCQGLIWAMEIDKDNNLWIGTIDGLLYYEIDNNGLARLTTEHGLAGTDISSIYCDSKNRVWVGSKGKGLTRIDDTVFTVIKEIGRITPTAIVEDSEGIIWIGSEGQGIYQLLTNDSINRYKVNNGLLANLITSLNIDDQDNLWIGSNKGLNKYDKKENKFYSYTERIGFTGIEVKNNASFKDSKGNMWFGTVKGVFKFNPEKEMINNLEPLTHFKRLRVNLKERDIIQNLRLNYREKSILIDYNSICLTDPDRVAYQVMLEGADDDWQPITTQTFKNYSPLPPGKYTFKVKARNNTGIWNAEPIAYRFTIRPPFWATWWFISICVIVITISIIFYIKARERQLIREKNILEEKVRERTKEVTEKNKELATKNQNITDSIKYAKRIQQAMLPDHVLVDNYLKEAFILYKPKDIVSGDFYWVEKLNNKILFSAVDCTGHGVPGALMSVVGYNGLHRIVSEFKLSNPSEILDKLNELVKETLQSSADSAVKDGMDMALCVLDRENNILEYAGAFNPLYLISKRNTIKTQKGLEIEPKIIFEDKCLYEIKGSKQPIGAYFKSASFVNHTIPLEKEDTIYVFSDGYADQFGGPKGKKFMYKQLKNLLLSIQHEEMLSQKEILNTTIENWMKNNEQIDDICMIGVKI